LYGFGYPLSAFLEMELVSSAVEAVHLIAVGTDEVKFGVQISPGNSLFSVMARALPWRIAAPSLACLGDHQVGVGDRESFKSSSARDQPDAVFAYMLTPDVAAHVNEGGRNVGTCRHHTRS
jgi:hypothetical protein